ncbi:MAG: carboxypeptidase regulatory-like domain-containing protein [Myxococcales bacterium]|nr:carboxypeptidase regulatory-like domain-containing protein [Myxococcales bacterium]
MGHSRISWLCFGLVFAACGADDEPPKEEAKACDVVAQTGCDQGQVCEETVGGEPACFAPISVTGRVFDTADDAAIEAARVVARDANGSAVSRVATTDEEGHYSLRVPVRRQPDGTPVSTFYTLRADAAGYLSFPKPPRVALPVDVSSANDQGEVASVATDIGLIALASSAGLGSVSGSVLAENPGGTLVVAGGATGIADADGAYTVFNVPAGSVSVHGYAAGLELNPSSADVKAGENSEGVDLESAGDATAVVSGSIQIVNGGGASETSVILVPEETFDETALRGEAPRGLRAAEVSGAWSISGVPRGRYVVLAAFENDGLVRDPDTSIGGTDLVRIDVSRGDLSISEGFKVTGALAVFSPGADGPEGVSGNPIFEWEDDSSEDLYRVSLFDALGEEVWTTEGAFDPGGSKPATVSYAGPALTPGMYYQFRATSLKDGVPISSTEDLKGVFYAE